MNDKIFEKAEWIWHDKSFSENEYAEFCEKFTYSGGKATLRISVCGDYTVFINGKFVQSNQYADFPHYKVYDELDIGEYLKKGENTVFFLVWYFGKTGMRYLTPTPGLIYEIFTDNTAVYSSENTPSRKSRAYLSGDKKKISPQLGYSFTYNSSEADNLLGGETYGFSKSVIIAHKNDFFKRPTEKLILKELKTGKISKKDGSCIIDLGEETVGLLSFGISSSEKQTLNISYGEILADGHVKQIIGERDFSIDYIAEKGKNEYTNYMFRFACRYIEINCKSEIDIEYIGLIPQCYPVKERNINLTDETDRKIYDMCVNTLKLCMMEHYVDCPWREQCFYAFDSRNQMLAGYSAFEGGNYDYARSMLLLMSKDNREDGLLSICFPSASDAVIPSFSLYYIIAVREYVHYSGDLSLGYEVFDKIESILKTFTNNMHDGLICQFTGKNRWNFYDWSPNADFGWGKGTHEPDFLINCIAATAFDAYEYLCEKLSKKNSFAGVKSQIIEKAREKFYNKNLGLFFVNDAEETPTELANSLAVLAGIAEDTETICEKLCANELTPCSLSMKTFKYDAMLKANRDKYKSAVLDEIRNTYKIMLDAGSSTVWETIEGSEAFGGAGSMCHGWSAIPVHYYRNLL